MAQNKNNIPLENLVAVTTAIMAVLAAIASLHAGTNNSLILVEKNNANLYQNQANKEWNTYLAKEVVSVHKNASPSNIESQTQTQEELQRKNAELENKVTSSTIKAQDYFEKTSNLSNAGTFLEIGIALSAMSVLLKKKSFWVFSLFLAAIGVYFLVVGFI